MRANNFKASPYRSKLFRLFRGGPLLLASLLLPVLLLAIHATLLAQADPLLLPGSPADGTDLDANAACAPYTDPVQLGFFYKPPGNMSLNDLVKHFDLYVLTKNDESQMEYIQNKGESPVLQYIKFDNIDDPCRLAQKPKGSACSCSKSPLNNQVAWNTSDICWIRDNHPDWFLRGSNGQLLYYKNELMMDPGNQGWRDWWLARIKTTQPDGWDGVFFDNVATEFGLHHGDLSVKLEKYPTAVSYQTAVKGFFNYVRTNYFKPQNRLMYGNIAVVWNTDDIFHDFMDHLDGAMDEFYGVPRSGWYRIKSFTRRVERAATAAANGKHMLLIAQGAQSDSARQQFALASYLLVAGPTITFRYTSDSAYSQVWLYNNYQAKLGSPKGSYTLSNGVFKRKFANGEVMVNPTARTSNITIYGAGDDCSPTAVPTTPGSPTAVPTGAPTGTPDSAISRVVLINSSNDTEIAAHAPLLNNAFIDLNVTGNKLNIKAETNPGTVGSVVFYLSGKQSRTWKENIKPYALFADDNGNFKNWTPAKGNYTLTITPYSGKNGTGTAGESTTIKFTVGTGSALNQPDVLVEGDFETDPLANPLWTFDQPDNNRLRCNKVDRENKPDKIVAFEGTCALEVQGKSVITRVLLQPKLVAGDVLNLGAMVNGRKVESNKAVKIKAKVSYADGTKGTLSLKVTAGTYDYTSFTDQLTVTGKVDKIKLQIHYAKGKGKGRIWLDNLRLYTGAGADVVGFDELTGAAAVDPALVPLPAMP